MTAGSKRRVLCIEDDAEMITLIQLILDGHGYEVAGVTSGSQGLAAARTSKPDVILLDLMMPEMDGWEVYRCLKQDAALSCIPVVIVTAKAQNIDRAMALRIAKVDDYITKPFAPQELVERVEAVLSKRIASDGG
jgi:DNA-binding response OmpR family regulator